MIEHLIQAIKIERRNNVMLLWRDIKSISPKDSNNFESSCVLLLQSSYGHFKSCMYTQGASFNGC
jgi:hypothetical protein